ncbi:PEF-CTERM sorting domain-containing protein [Methanolobus profundi]|uniref:PEF-CTERM protein sorting domain-containing protein n=1 Tax=Methanolobus profundi TaxID=487685 RepID=A0A1I4U782_9EURY|nr:PEF-CTERM sorting domain-containing protein [Methanolobus profundi]SFM84844.1 PEF-CTERM protein sorting domain-containing protein [Methanolobus profundi]
MGKQRSTCIVWTMFLLLFMCTGSAIADESVDYIISPDTLMLNSKAPYFAVEIFNTNGNYDIREIKPDSLRIMIDLPAGSIPGYVDVGELQMVKPNPEINEQDDKLVLMYYRQELYDTPFSYQYVNPKGKTVIVNTNVLDYLKDACDDATLEGKVDFRIRGQLYGNGKIIAGDAFTVDVSMNSQGGGSGGNGNCGGSDSTEDHGGETHTSGTAGGGQGGCNTEIPEFPSIVIPVMAIIGLMVFIQRRK